MEGRDEGGNMGVNIDTPQADVSKSITEVPTTRFTAKRCLGSGELKDRRKGGVMTKVQRVPDESKQTQLVVS